MSSTLIRSVNIDGVKVDICVSKEKESAADLVTTFIYELLTYDNE